jgi:hypothetical protein
LSAWMITLIIVLFNQITPFLLKCKPLYTSCSFYQDNTLFKRQQHVTTFGKKITSNSVFPLNSLNIHFKISNAFSITYCPCLRFLL